MYTSLLLIMNIDDVWQQFLNNGDTVEDLEEFDMDKSIKTSNPLSSVQHHNFEQSLRLDDAPICGSLNISTKTKLIYLNKEFDLYDIFWKLKTVDYDEEVEGIIKKQMKFNFINSVQVQDFEKRILNERCVKIKILNQINNPNGRVTFKDVRKVDIGICRNDVQNLKKESKSAFYNCLVMIFRKLENGIYNEYHVKLFNSGKVEIPGVQSEYMLNVVSSLLVSYLQPLFDDPIYEIQEKRTLILVNSNFNCNYYLNRELLVNILKAKYNIKCGLDSCNYPGIQCKYILNESKREVSFMIFRTGSVLIVGKCEDNELYEIYEFLKNVFREEYSSIVENESDLEKIDKQKLQNSKYKNKKSIYIYRTD